MRHQASRNFFDQWMRTTIHRLHAPDSNRLTGTGDLLDRTRLVVRRDRNGRHLVDDAGPELGAMFGSGVVGMPFDWLFRDKERAEIQGVVAGAEMDRTGCLLACTSVLDSGAVVAIEILLMPTARELPPALVGCLSAKDRAGDSRFGKLSLVSVRFPILVDEAVRAEASASSPRLTLIEGGMKA